MPEHTAVCLHRTRFNGWTPPDFPEGAWHHNAGRRKKKNTCEHLAGRRNHAKNFNQTSRSSSEKGRGSHLAGWTPKKESTCEHLAGRRKECPLAWNGASRNARNQNLPPSTCQLLAPASSPWKGRNELCHAGASVTRPNTCVSKTHKPWSEVRCS